jgi:hypothetical protein
MKQPIYQEKHCRREPAERLAVVQCENPKGLSFRSAALWREESAVSPPAASRFLADKAGFGMTRDGIVFVKMRHDREDRRNS